MMTPSLDRWMPRLLTLLVWALVAASVAQWSLRWTGASAVGASAPSLVASMAATTPAPDAGAVARVLGATDSAAPAAAAPLSGRLVLTGVVAASPSGHGVALIAVDGKPARAYRVGSRIEDSVFLLAVSARQAQLGPAANAPPTTILELPLKK